MKQQTLVFISLVFLTHLSAQNETQLAILDNLWQANRINPALVQANKVTIGLPSVYNNLLIENASLNKLIQQDGSNGNVITLDRVLDDLDNENNIRNSFKAETLSIGFWAGKFHFSASHTLNTNAYLNYPKELAEVIWNGNVAFIGETVDISHDLQLMSYSEAAIGVAFKVNKQLTLGGRVKFLNGLGDVSTTRNNLSLFTDDDIYEISLLADYELNSSSFFKYNGLDDLDNAVEFGQVVFNDFFTPNRGVAYDFGATIQFEQLRIGLSILDIGSIEWKDEVNNYKLQDTYEYAGLDIARDYFNNSLSFKNAVDSLKAIFEIEATQNNYTTELPTQYYVVASYPINDRWRVGASFYGENYRSEFKPAVGLQGQYKWSDMLSTGLHYSVYNERFDHIGLNIIANLGFIQIFGMTNDVIAAIDAKNSDHFDFRFGLNFVLYPPKGDEL